MSVAHLVIVLGVHVRDVNLNSAGYQEVKEDIQPESPTYIVEPLHLGSFAEIGQNLSGINANKNKSAMVPTQLPRLLFGTFWSTSQQAGLSTYHNRRFILIPSNKGSDILFECVLSVIALSCYQQIIIKCRSQSR